MAHSPVNQFYLLSWIMVAFLSASYAHAGTDRVVTAPLSLTLSGGVSLGAYQAGSLYYVNLLTQENAGRMPLELVTGSSAGALNAFISGLSICERGGSETDERMDESDFWRAWVEWKGSEFLSAGSDPRALLSRAPLERVAKILETTWNKGLPESCDFVMGVQLTRLKPDQVKSDSPEKFVRQSEKIALRIRGMGFGHQPEVTNYALSPAQAPQTLLALNEAGKSNFDQIKQLLFASSAFPIVFAPEKLRVCTTDSSQPRWTQSAFPLNCEASEATEVEYVDGGLVDNEPIAYAYELAQGGLEVKASGAVGWKDVPQLRRDDNPARKSTLFLNVDLENSSFPAPTKTVDSRYALPLAGALLGNLFNSSRDHEAVSTLTRDPAFSSQIASLRNSIPRVSSPLLGFFGFLERDFRAFDFYVGVLEAEQFVNATVLPTLRKSVGLNDLRPANLDHLSAGDRLKLGCLRAWLGDQPGAKEKCEAMNDANFFVLARLSREQLRTQNTDLAFVFQFLADHHYLYRDLGLEGDQAGQGPILIRSSASETISKLASQQPFSDEVVIDAATPLLLDLVSPLPSAIDYDVVLGPQISAEASLLLQRSAPYAFRGILGASAETLAGWLATDGSEVVPSLWVGGEWEPKALRSSLLQTRFSATLGYKFTPGEENEHCAHGSSSPLTCRGKTLRVGASLTAVGRIRFEIVLEAMPFVTEVSRVPFQVLPAIGLQF